MALAPGKHSVTFRYRPGSVLAGAVLSGLAALVLAVGALWLGVRRRGRERVLRQP